MIRRLVLITLLTLSTPLAAQDTTTPVEVVYTVNVQEPLSGRVKVTMRVENNRQEYRMLLYLKILLPNKDLHLHQQLLKHDQLYHIAIVANYFHHNT